MPPILEEGYTKPRCRNADKVPARSAEYGGVGKRWPDDWELLDSKSTAAFIRDYLRGSQPTTDYTALRTEPVATRADNADQFVRDLGEWRAQTRFSSNLVAKLSHPAYLRIIGLGPDALPLILKDLQNGGGHWFVALLALAREDPVPPEHRSLPRLMREDWLRWGVAKGLLDGELDVPTAVSGPDRNAFSATQD